MYKCEESTCEVEWFWKSHSKCWPAFFVCLFVYLWSHKLILTCDACHAEYNDYFSIFVITAVQKMHFSYVFSSILIQHGCLVDVWCWCSSAHVVVVRAPWTSASGEWGHQQCQGHLPLHHCRPLWLHVRGQRLGLWLQVSLGICLVVLHMLLPGTFRREYFPVDLIINFSTTCTLWKRFTKFRLLAECSKCSFFCHNLEEM